MLRMDEIQKRVREAAEEYPIKSIQLFGSYVDGNPNDDSDVDLLVEFQSPTVSLFTLSALQIRFEELLHTDVDVIHAPIPENSLIDIGRTVSLYEA